MPASFYLRLTATEKENHKLDRFLSWIIFFFSIAFAVVMTTINVIKIVHVDETTDPL
jgi:hypothetical protein